MVLIVSESGAISVLKGVSMIGYGRRDVTLWGERDRAKRQTINGWRGSRKSLGTFLAPFGYPMRTHGYRWVPIGIDFSGESQQDGSGIKRLYAFTRQGSEVQILSRLPIRSRS